MKNKFKELSPAELVAKRDELKRKHMELRFRAVIGHVENPLQKRTMRRQISQLNTLIHANVLSARKAVAIEAVRKIQAENAEAK